MYVLLISAVRATWQTHDFVPHIIRFTNSCLWFLAAPPALTQKCCAFCPQNTFI